ncbi:MAG: cell division ATP-binding protein FtsE [Cyanobacteria bacterium HKST-UBA06]|nr:cell division ATP-binding protein FtsE [Cyanobacteria bacterium HKST-UBA06]MCA9842780.1 cell division ATP-binding protein FtsE [Cyanobacteria bacterium HKST-UBA03]
MIQFIDTVKSYDNCIALDGVNFSISMGEFVFFVGASGAGKSTIMKLIYREEKPSEGRVLVGQRDVALLSSGDVPKLRRRMGIVFQDFKLLPGQSAFDNVAYVLRALGISPTEIRKRVLGALKLVGLIEKIDATPEELSGGEQQRVGIARAIVNGPAIVIADEPTGNLDPDTSLEIMQLLDQINRRGTTILVSTHDHLLVSQMRKRVIELRAGQIIRDEVEGIYMSS